MSSSRPLRQIPEHNLHQAIGELEQALRTLDDLGLSLAAVYVSQGLELVREELRNTGT